MRVLMLHNRYLLPGGEDQSTAAEVNLLREFGHEVELVEENNSRVEELGKLKTAINAVWSPQSRSRISSMLQQRKYDVLHVQNFFPLWSPSVYYAAASANVPVVQTLRNYRLICAGAILFREGKLCHDCVGRKIPFPAIRHACYRGTRSGAAAVATMQVSHRLLGTWNRRVHRYIALTEISREQFIAGGLPANRIAVKPNFVHPRPSPGTGAGDYVFFAGRFSPEKGIATLLAAWRRVKTQSQLVLAGDGPLTEMVSAAAAEDSRIRCIGRKSSAEVTELMRNARYFVFPSEWYEGMPRTVIESLAVGTPVLASDIGATASMIVDGTNGWHFQAGNVGDLAERIQWCLDNEAAVCAIRESTRQNFMENYTGETNIQQLIGIYHEARQCLETCR